MLPFKDKKTRCKQLVTSFKKLFKSTESESLFSVTFTLADTTDGIVGVHGEPYFYHTTISSPADYCLRDLVCLPVSHLWFSLMPQSSLPHQWGKSLSLPPTSIPLTTRLHLLAVACCLHLHSSPSMAQPLQTTPCNRVPSSPAQGT